ncbi:TPA: MBL fold metallo-hydrolase [Candidatus Micrarchaeota archaeon]|nr:MBL fold metallo-hydrolase [Candidatus Micrarchaeota archaeon]
MDSVGVKTLCGSCNGYVIEDLLIDAPAEVVFPSGIKKIIITHEHCDHIAGLAGFAYRVSSSDRNLKACGSSHMISHLASGTNPINFTNPTKIHASEFTADVISKKKNRYALCSFLEYEFPNVSVDPLKEGDTVQGAGISLQVIETPGHAKGAICLYNEANKILFAGDTIFPDYSMPRTDLPSSEPEKLRGSYERLAELEIKTIYPGHGKKITEEDYVKKLLRLF